MCHIVLSFSLYLSHSLALALFLSRSLTLPLPLPLALFLSFSLAASPTRLWRATALSEEACEIYDVNLHGQPSDFKFPTPWYVVRVYVVRACAFSTIARSLWRPSVWSLRCKLLRTGFDLKVCDTLVCMHSRARSLSRFCTRSLSFSPSPSPSLSLPLSLSLSRFLSLPLPPSLSHRAVASQITPGARIQQVSLSHSLQLLAFWFKVYWEVEYVCVNVLGFVCGLSDNPQIKEEFSLFYLTRG